MLYSLCSQVVLFLMFLITSIIFKWSRSSKKRMPPGPWGFPVLGYLPFLDAKAPYLTLSKLATKFGKVFTVQLGQIPCVVMTDPSLIRQTFSRSEFSGRAPLYLTHGIMAGYGLICAEGSLWKSQRKFTAEFMRRYGMTSFKLRNSENVGKMERKLFQCVDSFLSGIERSGQMELDCSRLDKTLSHTLGNMLNQIIFGISYSEKDPKWLRVQKLREDGIKELAVAGPVNFLPWIRHLVPKLKHTMDWIIQGKLESHREYERITKQVEVDMASGNPELDEEISSRDLDLEENESVSLTKAFLEERDRLKDQKSNEEQFFSKTQLHHLQGDLFGAGLDTTLTNLKWIILCLAKYPDVQGKMSQELSLKYGDSSQGPRLSDVENLPYTQAVILEVQRMFPVVPLGVPHGTTTWASINDGRYQLPPGCMVMVLHWHLNRNPELWSEPEMFNPDRFLSEAKDSVIVPKHFMPFQIGRRRCVGEDFGKMMLVAFVTKLVSKYTIQFTPEFSNYNMDQTHDHGFTLTPKNFKVILKQK